MGRVYRAHDGNLNRRVAIKVLPEAFADDADRLARFRREAQVLASLSHTNIAAIYGLEEAQGEVALALELVEGEDLAARLTRGAIPLDDALAIARQIADGLEAAHEKGIVHRDLKPANIRITPEGVVKLLDFGLAKQGLETAASHGAAASMSSPTFQSPAAVTTPGVILGTAAYMAPEQARGAGADKRADLWAFGVVLMEMLTGQHVFPGETVSDVLAAVLRRDIPWSALPSETPTPVRRLLRRCLQRDRKKRLADAASARLEIDDALGGEPDRVSVATAALSTRRRATLRTVLPAVAGTALVVSAVVYALVPRPAPPALERLVLTIVPPQGMVMTPVGTMASTPQLSPDGSAVLFKTESPRGYHVRRLAAMDVIKVPGSERLGNEPFWHGNTRVTMPTPDGAGGRLLDVRLPDGAPETVMTYGANVRGGGWTSDGQVILPATMQLLIGANGAPVRGDPGRLMYPEFIRGTPHVVFLRRVDRGQPEVILATMVDGAIADHVVLLKNDTAARFTPSGGNRLLFVRNENLYAQRLNLTTRSLEGEPELIIKEVASQPSLFRADFSVADNGTIAWRPGRAALSQVVTFNRQGQQLGVSGPPGAIETVLMSPLDDARLLVRGDAYFLVNAGEAGRASLPQDVMWAFWSPDGHLVGRRRETGFGRIGTDGAIEPIGAVADGVSVFALSPDGRFALGRVGAQAVWAPVAEMIEPKAWKPLTDLDETASDVSFSPDGRFVVYDARGVYVQPFPGAGRRQLVDGSGRDPVWRRDGREILYVRDDAVWSAPVSARGGTIAFNSPLRLFSGVRRSPSAVAQSQSLAVASNGSRFYLTQGVEQPTADVIHVLIGALRN